MPQNDLCHKRLGIASAFLSHSPATFEDNILTLVHELFTTGLAVVINALFHGQNRITSSEGTNHWIPFTEQELNAREKFDSDFMVKFIKGKIKPEEKSDIFNIAEEAKPFYAVPLTFSAEATAVFEAGKALWKYYHAAIKNIPLAGEKNIPLSGEKKGAVNASLYDIREYFQGRSDAGKMNNKSTDESYTLLIADLRDKVKALAQKIEPKVYEYGFLK